MKVQRIKHGPMIYSLIADDSRQPIVLSDVGLTVDPSECEVMPELPIGGDYDVFNPKTKQFVKFSTVYTLGADLIYRPNNAR